MTLFKLNETNHSSFNYTKYNFNERILFAELSKHMGLIDQPVASLLIQVPGIKVLNLTSLSLGLILCLTGHI